MPKKKKKNWEKKWEQVGERAAKQKKGSREKRDKARPTGNETSASIPIRKANNMNKDDVAG